jgi:hypothetical protein
MPEETATPACCTTSRVTRFTRATGDCFREADRFAEDFLAGALFREDFFAVRFLMDDRLALRALPAFLPRVRIPVRLPAVLRRAEPFFFAVFLALLAMVSSEQKNPADHSKIQAQPRWSRCCDRRRAIQSSESSPRSEYP